MDPTQPDVRADGPKRPDAPARIGALVSDLIFGSKIAGTAAALGIAVEIVRTRAAIQRLLDRQLAWLIDLQADPASVEIIREIKDHSPNSPVIAFVPHVAAELRQQAAGAGADQVLTRSRFSDQLPQILQRLSAASAA